MDTTTMKTLHTYDKVPDYIREKKPFQTRTRAFMDAGSGWHVMGEWRGDMYVVYSYGTHFPMFAYDRSIDRWYRNGDKFSRTTSRHQWRFAPPNIHETLDTENMKMIVERGGWVQHIAGIVSAP